MVSMNFRDAYGFAPQDPDSRSAQGLVGLLQQIMQQQQALRQGVDIGPTQNIGANPFSGSDGGPEALLGRLLAVRADHGQPIRGSDAQMLPARLDPNFRQLSRVSNTVQPQGAVDPYNRSGYQMSPASASYGDGGSLNAQSTPTQYGGSSKTQNKSQPVQLADMAPIMRGLRPPRPIFPGPAEAPEGTIPTPTLSGWWELIKKLAPFFPMISSNPDGGDPRFETFRRCMRAAGRNTQAWEDFCDDLDPDAKQLRAICYSNTYKPNPEEKKGFCREHFTPN